MEGVAGVVQKLLSHYDLDWDTVLTPQQAWSLAAKGVNDRAIHPDFAPDLGNTFALIFL